MKRLIKLLADNHVTLSGASYENDYIGYINDSIEDIHCPVCCDSNYTVDEFIEFYLLPSIAAIETKRKEFYGE